MADKMFLVRRPDGTIATVISRSTRAAARKLADEEGVRHGEVVRVKQRGSDDEWEAFRVTERP